MKNEEIKNKVDSEDEDIKMINQDLNFFTFETRIRNTMHNLLEPVLMKYI